ncbi:MAG TPA: hypothetical protein VIO94_05335, partial [Phenylobacterium sp.]
MTSAPTKGAAYLVLGMHRSGTSALTKALSSLGTDLPAHVMPGDEHNEAGYYESWPIAVLNDQWLRACGSAWDDPFAYPLNTLAPAQEAEWTTKAAELFDEEFGDSRRPLLKDPRVSLLAPAWFDILEAKGFEVRCVISSRGPAAVAKSLERRNGFSLQRGVLIWASYMLAAERYSRGRTRVFVAYEALLEDWRREAGRVCRTFGDPEPEATGEEAVDRSLRHHAGAE